MSHSPPRFHVAVSWRQLRASHPPLVATATSRTRKVQEPLHTQHQPSDNQHRQPHVHWGLCVPHSSHLVDSVVRALLATRLMERMDLVSSLGVVLLKRECL